MNLARSSVKLAAASVSSAVVTFVGIAYFARLLDPAVLGAYFLFEALLQILVIPADFGIRGAVEKRLSEGERPGTILSTAVLLKLIPLAVVGGAILVFGGFINGYVGEDVALLLVVSIVAHELYQLGIKILGGELRVGESAIIRLTQKVVWVAVGAFLVQRGFGVRGLIFGVIAGYVVAFFWGMARRSTPFGRPSRGVVYSLTSYSRYNFLSALSGYFYSWMDVLIIGLLLTSASVGAYETAWRVTLVVVLGSRAIAESIFPQVSQWRSQDAVERIEKLIPRAITSSFVIVVPAFFGTLLLSREIMTYVFTPEYAVAWLVLIVLMGEKLFQSIHTITGRSLKAIDRPEFAAYAAVASIVVNLGLNLVLVWQVGLVGAAIATFVASLVNTAMCLYYLARFLDVRFPWRDVGWLTASSVCMTLALGGILSVIDVDSLLRLVGVILVGAAVYGVVVLQYPPLRSQAVRSLRMISGNEEGGSGSADGGD